MEHLERIYLDNAATSWPKPDSVVNVIRDFYQRGGSAAGRGIATDALHTDRSIRQIRNRLANFVGASDPSHLVFTFNGTDSLNMAIQGVLRKGDHVITTVLEHNSVLRPLQYLRQTGLIELSIIGIDSTGRVDLNKLDDAIINNTKLICVSHVSNVLGSIQPVREIGAIEKPQQCLFLVDAAQSLGHLPIDVTEFQCDLLATSGHKGLLGPLGTGFLHLSNRAAEQIEPFRLGGTGTTSEQITQPQELPYRLESGNLNVAGILGMGQGLEFISSNSLEFLSSAVSELVSHLLDFARQHDAIQIYSNAEDSLQTGVVSFNIEPMEPTEIASLLDLQFGIQVRAGLHCSPLAHKAIGTDNLGGTVRVSVGPFNKPEEIAKLIDALEQLIES